MVYDFTVYNLDYESARKAGDSEPWISSTYYEYRCIDILELLEYCSHPNIDRQIRVAMKDPNKCVRIECIDEYDDSYRRRIEVCYLAGETADTYRYKIITKFNNTIIEVNDLATALSIVNRLWPNFYDS